MAQISANERAALDMIRMAEGTWHGGGQKGYGTMFGGGQFDWSKGHPDRVVRSGGYASAAAGAYHFSPEAQDRAALQLIRNRGVDPTKPMDTAMLAKLSPEWASLPTAAGKSYYNQPVKGQKELLGFYGQRVGAAPNPGNQAPTAAPATPSAGGAAIAGAVGGGGGALAGIDFASLLGDSSSPVDRPVGSAAAAAVLQQQGQEINSTAPMLNSVRRQVSTRMAGSPGRNFMQQLLELTQRPGAGQLLA